jgi:hypothetical protein
VLPPHTPPPRISALRSASTRAHEGHTGDDAHHPPLQKSGCALHKGAPDSVRCAGLSQALLRCFEARIPRLVLAVYILVERLPCIELGQLGQGGDPRKPLRSLPSLAKFFRKVPGPSGRAFSFE